MGPLYFLITCMLALAICLILFNFLKKEVTKSEMNQSKIKNNYLTFFRDKVLIMILVLSLCIIMALLKILA